MPYLYANPCPMYVLLVLSTAPSAVLRMALSGHLEEERQPLLMQLPKQRAVLLHVLDPWERTRIKRLCSSTCPAEIPKTPSL